MTPLQFFFACLAPAGSFLAGALYVGRKLEVLTALVKRLDKLEEEDLHARISTVEALIGVR